jgi:hypothetical protein
MPRQQFWGDYASRVVVKANTLGTHCAAVVKPPSAFNSMISLEVISLQPR